MEFTILKHLGHTWLYRSFLNTVDDQPFATMIPLDRPSPSGYARFQE